MVSKVDNVDPKVPKQAEASRDGVINTDITISFSFIRNKVLMLSKRYESNECECRTWIHLPSGTQWSTSSDILQVWNIKKKLLLRCLYHFKSDFINNIDHVRISENEPSSVMLSQTKWFQSWQNWPESAKTSWSKKGKCNRHIKLR